MNVLILTSANNEVNDYYKSIARLVSNYLAKNGYDLVYGGSSTSMMGICYDEFQKHDRMIYAFTTEKYKDDLENLPKARKYIRQTTFEMKQAMFESSDLIVVLPGGIGTLSELFAFIEENRSNDKDIPIEIFDENNYYQKLFELIDFMKEEKFVSEDVMSNINVSHNLYELEENLDNLMKKKENIK